ncbi:hypothetical protein [Piscinibacter sp.]|jgi:hypothetical protein|uniref:hypothetical protein n=1 Tax=Piscinibacter sp. TaxID=1903157 RepID=UPI002F411371
MNELDTSLHAIGPEQFVLAFAFLISYPLSLSSFAGLRGRRWAGLGAFAAAAGFAALTDPWMNGVLLLAVAVVGVGLFVAAVWAMSAMLGLVEGRMARTTDVASDADERVVPDSPRAVVARSG